MKKTALILFSIVQAKAWACSCVTAQPPEVEFARATAVFIGRIIRLELVPDREFPGHAFRECTLEIEEKEDAFKGAGHISKTGPRRVIVVRTESSSAACGFSFVLQQRYLVYTHGDRILATDICTRTQSYDAVDKAELKILRELAKKE
jgi:Tissue inhibitor of metalloproteinase